ncbi:putative Ig domain-containing protein [Streptomyces sp. NPDC048419]|uniref:putative Ig domain-containing protein n=1 Tax=Streptomyces sp. NPDC048419 TaxID=3365547 RepID=UPI0037229403
MDADGQPVSHPGAGLHRQPQHHGAAGCADPLEPAAGDTTGKPTPKLTASGTPPTGVTFTDNGDDTGSFTGTSATTSSGTYKLTLTATNSAGNATQQYMLTVGPYKTDLQASISGPTQAPATPPPPTP